MGDTRGQPAQRGQLELLQLLVDERSVLEHDQRAVVAQRRELGLPFGAAVVLGEGVQRRSRLGHPALPQVAEPGRHLRQALAGDRVGQAQGGAGGFIDQLDLATVVDHQDAGLHVLKNVLVQRGHVLQVDLALRRQGGVLAAAPADRNRQQRGGEQGGAEEPGLGVVLGAVTQLGLRQHLFGQHGQRGGRREHQRVAFRDQGAHGADVDDQQHADAAADAAAGMHQDDDQQNVEIALGIDL